MFTIRRALPVAAAFTFVLASCGGSSDGDEVETTDAAVETTVDETDDFTEVEATEVEATEDEVEAPAETSPEEPAETVAAGETVVPDPEGEGAATTDPTDDPVVGDAAAAGIDVALSEWAITAPTDYTAGEITFNASNGGSFPHEFVVIEGEGYEQLPLLEGGAVDEDNLPTGALIARTGRMGGGSAEALTVTLAPGNYVLVCNLIGGGSSHAARGQRLDITVS